MNSAVDNCRRRVDCCCARGRAPACCVDLQDYFHEEWLTVLCDLVIIVGFALEGEEFCLTEASQVVCGVDDGPKTDWLVACKICQNLRSGQLVQVGTKFK